MRYIYRDVNDFQLKNPTRATRENALEAMSVREILHIARSCVSAEARAYYEGFAREAVMDSLQSRFAAESRRAWQEEMTA